MPQSWKVLGILALLLAVPVRAEEPVRVPASTKVAGAVENEAEWTPEKLGREFAADIRELRYTLKGKEHAARVVPLVKLIASAKPKIDPKRKNPLVAFAAIVSGGDGYTATFSLGELLPEFGAAVSK